MNASIHIDIHTFTWPAINFESKVHFRKYCLGVVIFKVRMIKGCDKLTLTRGVITLSYGVITLSLVTTLSPHVITLSPHVITLSHHVITFLRLLLNKIS
jgi:hypothetical protein